MRVIILSGFPGSGKSYTAERTEDAFIVSADNYLPKAPTAPDFGKAHQRCFLDAINEMRVSGAEGTLIVDNTNLTAAEIAPYYLAAEAYGHEVSIKRIHCDESVAWGRQTHDVPFATFCKMVANFAKRDVMPWWTVYEVR